MRKNLGVQPALFPMPVVIVAAYGADGNICAMNAAWAQICDTDKIALFIDADHKTTQNIMETKAFTVSIADAAHLVEADYFGVVSAKNEPRKFENSGLTAERSDLIDAPVINEFPLCLECEFIEYQADEYGIGVIGKVLRVTADEGVMDGDKVDMSRVNAIAFDPYTHGYYRVSERVGEAFRDGLKLKKGEA